MTDKYKELRDAIGSVTPQNFDSAERKFDCEDSYVECPCCCGEGTVDLVADYINYDNCAIGVQFYGIGEEHVSAEAYYGAATPETISALLAERDALLEALENLHSIACRCDGWEQFPSDALDLSCDVIEAAKRQEG